MADALSRYRQAEPSKDALKRYRQEPSGDTLGALAKYLGLQGYWDRQGQIAQDGLNMAEQGAQTVRGGDPRGFAGMFMGPAGYLASPITALLPTEAEAYAAPDLPEWSKPGMAGILGTAMAVMPGPKFKGLGRGMTALADGATDAERAALASRLETEAAQTGGQAVATPRDQALRNLTEAPEGMTAKPSGGTLSNVKENYAGEHGAPDAQSGSPLHDVSANGTYPADFYSHNGLRYYGTGDDALDASTYQKILSFRNNPDAMVRVWRAVPWEGKGKRPTALGGQHLNPGDWVTLSRQYAIDHGESALNGNYALIATNRPARELYTAGDSMHEWGWSPEPKK